MAKRRIHAETTGERMVKVFYDSDMGEYIVRLYVNGILYPPADYFTDDRQDAIDTSAAMCRPIQKIKSPRLT